MTYIYRHFDLKILKLGIKWALYREKKPEEALSIYKEWHEESRIAYLKEAEFKVGEIIYYKGTPYSLIELVGNKPHLQSCLMDGHDTDTIITNIKIKELSHYCPGQEYDGDIKYVREINFYEFKKVPDDGSKWNEWKNNKWQELEEPAEYINTYNIGSGADSIGFPIPHEIENLETNPKHTQFQEDVNEGIILAITKQ